VKISSHELPRPNAALSRSPLSATKRHGLVTRARSDRDERELVVALTEKGEQLRENALAIPYKMGKCLRMSAEEFQTLYGLLYKLLAQTDRTR
jgi:DNA-binding MarR family transcriptional regulator